MKNIYFKLYDKKIFPGLFALGVFFILINFQQACLAQNLPQPKITCVTVEENNDVTISWDPVADPNNLFASYHVFFSNTQGGPFAEIPGTNLTDRVANTSYLHTGIDPNNQVFYYYIIANDGLASASPPSITWSSVKLSLVNENNGIITLNWNTPLNHGNRSYNIYTKPSGTAVWNVLANNIALEEYKDTIVTSSCGQEIDLDYRIEVVSSGCFSSVTTEKGLTDVIRPEEVKINFVTVDPATGFVTIQWEQNKSKDIQGYTLFQKNQDKWITTDVNGKLVITYTDNTVNANDGQLIYGLEAYDNCSGNELGILHATVFLEEEVNPCAQEVRLTWLKDEGTDQLGRPYGWLGNIKAFEIWYQEDNDPEKLLGSVDQNTKEYVHKNLAKGVVYKYRIKAISATNGFESFSNQRIVTLDNIVYNGEIEISTATVSGTDAITVIGIANLDIPGNGFGVLRSENPLGPFSLVTSIAQPAANPITIVDNKVFPLERSYYYKIVALDQCGNQIGSSATEIAKTILLQKDNNTNETIISFSWNEYETWVTGIQEYQILRNTGNQFELIATLPSTDRFYTDVLGGVNQMALSDRICYVIRAIKSEATPDEPGYSNSNTLCFEFETLEWIPNAFHVNSHIETNRIFKPVLNFFNLDTYQLRIYNRWGEKVFETTDPQEGWNGNSHNKPSPQGVYIYEISYQQSNIGKTNIKKTGTVTLVR